MQLRLGVERELARAEFTARIHCLVFVVPLERVSLARFPKHLHIVIACGSSSVYTLSEKVLSLAENQRFESL
jgi:hypothetical protein